MFSLPPPNWPDVLGAVDEAAWIADRDRKFGRATKAAKQIQETFKYLSERNAIFEATPEILCDHPFAARWYVSLAGYSQKTLQNVRERPRAYGLNVRPNSVVDGVRERPAEYQVPGKFMASVSSFCLWINDEIAEKHPIPNRDLQRALVVVAQILGGRIIGQGQNEGGDAAVLLVKELLVRRLYPAFTLEVNEGAGWEEYGAKHSIADLSLLRFGSRMTIDFTSGGNRPDIAVTVDGKMVAVGEIKGRKDLSNLWESWMPQVATHLNTWAGEFPNAVRLFFGTLIVDQMVQGFSMKGTQQIGFQELYAQRKINAVYNVGNVIAGHPGAVSSFNALVDALSAILQKR